FPPACTKCSTLTGILSKIPSMSASASLAHRSIIQNLVSSSETIIQTLEAELSQLQSQLTNIRTFKTFHHTLISPMRRLPDELLGEIFAYVIGEDGIDIGTLRGIWDLWRVCTRWRDIIKGTPSFWSTFYVDVIQIKPATISLRIQICLKLSGKSPLSISILPTFQYRKFLFQQLMILQNIQVAGHLFR
ncbi:hypothetical protein BDQ17DRAFT_1356999, partial [Cyathus striatus]